MKWINKKYNIIYADPPRTFKTYSQKWKEKKSAECHYDCMTIEDIYNLPVWDIASDDSVLFLRVTFPLLQEWLETIRRRWFTYKTCWFNRVKKNKKADSFFRWLWYWTRSNSELCLIATKWKPKRISKSVHQVVYEPIREHSRKPDIVRDKIVYLCGDLPRIELFARTHTDWWDARWNQKDLFIES